MEGCPDDDIDLVCRGRVEVTAVDGVLPDTSVRLGGTGRARGGGGKKKKIRQWPNFKPIEIKH